MGSAVEVKFIIVQLCTSYTHCYMYMLCVHVCTCMNIPCTCTYIIHVSTYRPNRLGSMCILCAHVHVPQSVAVVQSVL